MKSSNLKMTYRSVDSGSDQIDAVVTWRVAPELAELIDLFVTKGAAARR
jgi:hypothetical protein